MGTSVVQRRGLACVPMVHSGLGALPGTSHQNWAPAPAALCPRAESYVTLRPKPAALSVPSSLGCKASKPGLVSRVTIWASYQQPGKCSTEPLSPGPPRVRGRAPQHGRRCTRRERTRLLRGAPPSSAGPGASGLGVPASQPLPPAVDGSCSALAGAGVGDPPARQLWAHGHRARAQMLWCF